MPLLIGQYFIVTPHGGNRKHFWSGSGWIESPAPAGGREWFNLADFAEPPDGLAVTVDRGTLAPDCMFALGTYAMFSEAAMEIVGQNLSVCPDFQWAPVKLLNRRKRMLAKYWTPYLPLPVTPKEYDILDRDRAEFSVFPGTNIVSRVHEWIVRLDLVPPLDLLVGTCSRLFCSRKLVELVHNAALTNFGFEPVPAWRP